MGLLENRGPHPGTQGGVVLSQAGCVRLRALHHPQGRPEAGLWKGKSSPFRTSRFLARFSRDRWNPPTGSSAGGETMGIRPQRFRVVPRGGALAVVTGTNVVFEILQSFPPH